jgi:hypothetical protein
MGLPGHQTPSTDHGTEAKSDKALFHGFCSLPEVNLVAHLFGGAIWAASELPQPDDRHGVMTAMNDRTAA